jgi:hypothetical protein
MMEKYPAGSMWMLEPGTESDGFNHYIVTPAAVKEHALKNQKEIGEGEYVYWH